MIRNKVLTSTEIYNIIKKYRIKIGPFSVDDRGRINVYGNVSITHTNLQKLPLNFGKITGNFHCQFNKLTTLKGSPHTVSGDFDCSNNNLKTLKYCSNEVGGDFFCQENQLEKLDGSPRRINRNFNCFSNNLTNFKNGPLTVDGSFYAFANKLTSLEGAPEYIGESFFLVDNYLQNLYHLPKYIGHTLHLDCSLPIIKGSNCLVSKVDIHMQDVLTNSDKILHQAILSNCNLLHIVLKYNTFLNLYDDEGKLNLENFNDIILEIREGLR